MANLTANGACAPTQSRLRCTLYDPWAAGEWSDWSGCTCSCDGGQPEPQPQRRRAEFLPLPLLPQEADKNAAHRPRPSQWRLTLSGHIAFQSSDSFMLVCHSSARMLMIQEGDKEQIAYGSQRATLARGVATSAIPRPCNTQPCGQSDCRDGQLDA